jgi:hypothetical protein
LPYADVGSQVVANKTKNDNKIFDMMDDIRKALPRLESWDGIYPTDGMRDLVANAFSLVVEFSRKAVEYLSRFKSKSL